MEPLLKIEKLQTWFETDRGLLKAVDEVDLEVLPGETLGVVGESGCGKSVTSLSVMRLVQSPGKIIGGRILYQGRNLLQISEDEMRTIRGNQISMIFQEPMTSLNPVFTCGDQIMEAIILHQKLNRTAARARALELLKQVGIPDPDARLDQYPHELSGGMRQRIMIAMALSCSPELLIADEPTTALDVTIQAQILQVIRNLQQEQGMSVMIITHDLGVVAEVADRVAVLYAGKVVEVGTVFEIFHEARHPYTIGLQKSLPRPGKNNGQPLNVIPGNVPDLRELPPGCPFAPRCARVMDVCRRESPRMRMVSPGHDSRCHLEKD